MTLEQQKQQATAKTNGASHQDKDWAQDYDIFDRDYIKDPFPVWDELREKCPIAHTERWGGSWMPTRYADLFAIDWTENGESKRRRAHVCIGGSEVIGGAPTS